MGMKTKAPRKAVVTTRKGRPDNPERLERLVETARKIGVDENSEASERAFEKIVPSRSGSGQNS
jgi:hypothetical protein